MQRRQSEQRCDGGGGRAGEGRNESDAAANAADATENAGNAANNRTKPNSCKYGFANFHI